jgi:hypothetical protein
MRHYKAGPGLRLSIAAVAILIPLAGSVNYSKSYHLEPTKSLGLKADGIPVPPLPPPKATAIEPESLIADGIPVPPLPPPKLSLVADGIPVPPLPPPKGGTVAIVVV